MDFYVTLCSLIFNRFGILFMQIISKYRSLWQPHIHRYVCVCLRVYTYTCLCICACVYMRIFLYDYEDGSEAHGWVESYERVTSLIGMSHGSDSCDMVKSIHMTHLCIWHIFTWLIYIYIYIYIYIIWVMTRSHDSFIWCAWLTSYA